MQDFLDRNPTYKGFLKYAMISLPVFVLDLFLLFFLTDFLGLYYVASAAIAFGIATTINYYFTRKHVFTNSLLSFEMGYVFFMLIAIVGLVMVTSLIYIFVDVFGINYILSRVIISGVTGLWNYLMNLYMNLKMSVK